MEDINNRSDIIFLIDTFYKSILTDDLIGVFFTEVVKLNVDLHMPIMYDFWESTLLSTAKYKGNPMMKHIELNNKKSLNPIHFERWLNVWEKTIQENFVGEKSEEAIKKGKSIGELMKFKLKQHTMIAKKS